jgi:hypothetical protein
MKGESLNIVLHYKLVWKISNQIKTFIFTSHLSTETVTLVNRHYSIQIYIISTVQLYTKCMFVKFIYYII